MIRSDHIPKIKTIILPGIVAALCSMGIWAIDGWKPIEQSAYNSLFKVRERFDFLPKHGWDERIAVITIDEKSVGQYGRFPWSRDRYTDLLNTLIPAQPAVVSFDILLPEPSDEDVAFATAISNSNNVVLAVGADIKGQFLDISPIIKTEANGNFWVGHVNVHANEDGISRQAWLYEGPFRSFGVATVEMYDTVLSNTLADPATMEQLEAEQAIGERFPYRKDLPTHSIPEQERWINWPGPIPQPVTLPEDGTFDSSQPIPDEGQLSIYSFADVLSQRVDPSIFQNKIVLVGSTLTGTDPLRTPFNHDVPTSGVYLHAAIVDNLLTNHFLHRPPRWSTLPLLLIVGLGTSLILGQQKLRGRLVFSVIIPFGWFTVAFLAFLGHGWIPIAAPIGTVLITIIGFQWQEQLEKQQMMNLFSMHVAPEMAQLIWSRRDELLDQGQLQPQELTATVLFIDIRGFTSIAENMVSHDLITWLNQYFDVMTNCIMKQGGVVDKYIGDAIMAVFGIPFPRIDMAEIQQDAIAAVTASINMVQRLEQLNRELADTGQPTISIGIGVHTGTVTAGSVGNRQRVNYSVFGDTVNTAARLESMTKTLPADAPYHILMSESTFSHVYQQYAGKAFGLVKIKGRKSQAMTYTLTDNINA